MDTSLTHHRSFIGRPATGLPTPALVLRRSTLESNIERLLKNVDAMGIQFRPHVKTLKSLEITRLMLKNGLHRKIVASTLCEIRGVLPLVKEGILEECLYGLPCCSSILPELVELSQNIKIVLMIDNEQHVDLLERFSTENPTVKPWDVFIKVDIGTHRAGIASNSSSLLELIQRVESSSATSIYGFYCHGGHSYGCRTPESVEAVLEKEVSGVLEAAKMMRTNTPIVISVGSTPTAHVIKRLTATLPAHLHLELHAGCYVANDLQQVTTGLITEDQQAIRILSEVCSVYPERNEALVNAGVIALSRETSDFPGFGKVVDAPDWSVVRLSQEHGILGMTHPPADGDLNAEDRFRIGQKVFLYCQHACITAAAFHVYYIVDDEDIVRDTWIPWKGW